MSELIKFNIITVDNFILHPKIKWFNDTYHDQQLSIKFVDEPDSD